MHTSFAPDTPMTADCAPLLPQIVFLHGYAMQESDLAAFAPSLGLRAQFHFLRGPQAVPAGGFAWWPIDGEAKAQAMAQGPRDLAQSHPSGREAARKLLGEHLRQLRQVSGGGPVYLVGFSQGGMLACETVLHEDVQVDALILLSSSRIAFDEWAPLMHRVAGLPVLVAHGEQDDDLSFVAGDRLHGALREAGADVEWLPFEGGHQIPFIVWRTIRKFLLARGVEPMPRRSPLRAI